VGFTLERGIELCEDNVTKPIREISTVVIGRKREQRTIDVTASHVKNGVSFQLERYSEGVALVGVLQCIVVRAVQRRCVALVGVLQCILVRAVQRRCVALVGVLQCIVVRAV
jgi:hypothetical protein